MHFHLLLAYLVDHANDLVSSQHADEVKEIVQAAEAGKPVHNSVVDMFLKAFASECLPKIDSLDDTFFESSKNKRWKTLGTWSTSTMLKVLVGFVVTANAREVQTLVRDIYETFGQGKGVIKVTTPRPLDTKTKTNIRKSYSDGVVFQVDRDLVGGMHIYQDGTISDKSFASLLSRISNLTV